MFFGAVCFTAIELAGRTLTIAMIRKMHCNHKAHHETNGFRHWIMSLARIKQGQHKPYHQPYGRMHIYHIPVDLLTSASFTEDATTAESPFPATVRFTNAAVPANATRGRGSLLALLGKWQADSEVHKFCHAFGLTNSRFSRMGSTQEWMVYHGKSHENG